MQRKKLPKGLTALSLLISAAVTAGDNNRENSHDENLSTVTVLVPVARTMTIIVSFAHGRVTETTITIILTVTTVMKTTTIMQSPDEPR